MSRREELASALVRTQERLRGCEKALARFMSRGSGDKLRLTGQHSKLIAAVALARQDRDVIQRELKRERDRPFDLLREKMMGA